MRIHCELPDNRPFENILWSDAPKQFCPGPISDPVDDRKLRLHLEIRPTGALIACCIKDNGATDTNPSPGRGLWIDTGLVNALCATIDMQSEPDGTRTVVNVPHRA
jgi:hypothetical protein